MTGCQGEEPYAPVWGRDEWPSTLLVHFQLPPLSHPVFHTSCPVSVQDTVPHTGPVEQKTHGAKRPHHVGERPDSDDTSTRQLSVRLGLFGEQTHGFGVSEPFLCFSHLLEAKSR